MTENFRPPIEERTNNQLFEIVGSPNKWNPNAVILANKELKYRKVGKEKIKTAKYLSKKRDRVDKRIKANESYHICDFRFNISNNRIVQTPQTKKPTNSGKAVVLTKLPM